MAAGERAVVLARGNEVSVKDLADELTFRTSKRSRKPSYASLKDMEAQMIKETLDRCAGNKSMAARMLGMSRKTLYKRIEDLNLQ